MNSKKILIVEDEKPMQKVLSLKLERAGYKVFTASNGKESIDLIKKNNFDLVLLDLIMPQMDGFITLEEIKKIKPLTPVIVLTNLGQDEDRKKVKKMGAKGFFVKSDISISEIVSRVESFFDNNEEY